MTVKKERVTNETKIEITLNPYGSGDAEIHTGIGFFDHMLMQIARHGSLDLYIHAKGDLEVDSHHTIEDVGILLGQTLKLALSEPTERYGSITLPMEEALVLCALDICNRAYLNFDVTFTMPKIGEMDTEMVEEFFRALCFNAGITLHLKMLDGKNNHHIAEACFKAFGKALKQAMKVSFDVQSTKGVI